MLMGSWEFPKCEAYNKSVEHGHFKWASYDTQRRILRLFDEILSGIFENFHSVECLTKL